MMATTITNPVQKNIVIIGGGIIGCTSAYFLTRHPSFNPATTTITLIEAQSIASGASGKAGGLLAEWARPSCIVPLSYKLHAELAKEHNGAERWGYRELNDNCGTIATVANTLDDATDTADSEGKIWKKLPKMNSSNGEKKQEVGVPETLDWVERENIRSYSTMGDGVFKTAQVHPYQFTTSMFDLAVEKGLKVIYGMVTAIDYTGSHVKSVTYEDKESKHIHTIHATDVLLSAGPWTSHVWPEAPVEAQRAHSVVVEANVSPWAVFTDIELPKGFGKKVDKEKGGKKRRHAKFVNPEMYARPDGTVYACGEADDDIPLPRSSNLVQCDESRCDDMLGYLGAISEKMKNGKVLAKQACYLPMVPAGRRGDGPWIGETGVKGLWIAAGHTCWGVQNSCATGKVISEFLFEGEAKSADVGSLDFRRFVAERGGR